jgi:integrase
MLFHCSPSLYCRTASIQQEADSAAPKELPKKTKAPKDARLSKDGDWRLFSNESHLMQYIRTGMFYGRVKVRGKTIRRKLHTSVYTTAKLRLLDFLKEHKTRTGSEVDIPTFQQAKELYEKEIKGDQTLSPKTVTYKDFILKLIARTWPALGLLRLDRITPTVALEWSGNLAREVSAETYNHTLGVFRAVFDRGVRHLKENVGNGLENPGTHIKRLGVKPKKLLLPEPNQFIKLVETVATAGGGFSQRCADLIKFLAFSGFRISEAKQVTWADVDQDRNELVINSAKHRQTSSGARIRRVPIIPQMKELLEKLRSESNGATKPNHTICRVHECQKALDTDGIARITHHDLRHLFATRCIESGVDIPTVARWLGHKDGGALAMKVYGHLRNEHSQAMAQKVKF